MTFPWPSRLLPKVIKNFAQIVKPRTILMCHNAHFIWMPDHQAVFISLNGALIQAPIPHYPDPFKQCIVYTDASDDAFGAYLSQEYNDQQLPAMFLLHTFTNTQWKWSTPKQEACDVYYSITKWNYFLQGSDIIMYNDNKPLQKFLYGKNVNNKINWWSLELTMYNITLKWILDAQNKAADCLSQLVTPAAASILINMAVASASDGPATGIHNRTKIIDGQYPLLIFHHHHNRKLLK